MLVNLAYDKAPTQVLDAGALKIKQKYHTGLGIWAFGGETSSYPQGGELKRMSEVTTRSARPEQSLKW